MMLLSEVLKERTAKSHREIEKCEGLRNLLSPDLTLAEYLLILQCWKSFLGPIERAMNSMEEMAGLMDDLATRKKIPWLDADIQNGGLGAKRVVPDSKMALSTPAVFWGYLYVIEGSTLGARVITKKLVQHGTIPKTCLNFYFGYREQAYPKWAIFKQALDAWGEQHPDKYEEVVEAAMDAFDSLRKVIDSNYSKENLEQVIAGVNPS
ncbi:biliverdin-producing heme oxygenase [bacterium SCSIO 12741]|nr:biliverdin-producing heme oxygenase [bacterium SCSIO 12741]